MIERLTQFTQFLETIKCGIKPQNYHRNNDLINCRLPTVALNFKLPLPFIIYYQIRHFNHFFGDSNFELLMTLKLESLYLVHFRVF